jgi:hypothetical protein
MPRWLAALLYRTPLLAALVMVVGLLFQELPAAPGVEK